MQNNETSALELEEAIPDQFVAAGKEFNLELNQFINPRAGEILNFKIEDAPEGFTISPEGRIVGIAPTVVVNRHYQFQVKIESNLTSQNLIVLFTLVVVGTALLDSKEARILFGLEETNVWQSLEEWEILQFLQQLINEHFVCIYFYDGSNPPKNFGRLIDNRIATSGWAIRHFENVLVIGAGDKAFEEYGNRSRLLQTLVEVCQKDLPQKNWSRIRIGGSDTENIGKAWVVAKRYGLPVSEIAPNDTAEINLQNLERVKDIIYKSGKGLEI